MEVEEIHSFFQSWVSPPHGIFFLNTIKSVTVFFGMGMEKIYSYMKKNPLRASLGVEGILLFGGWGSHRLQKIKNRNDTKIRVSDDLSIVSENQVPLGSI